MNHTPLSSSFYDKGQVNGVVIIGGTWIITKITPRPVVGRIKIAKTKMAD
jgi:hypothetical protein